MKPRKRFGQNFLVDAEIVQNIFKVVAPVHTDHLVEIGPGLGVLTKTFLGRTQRFDLIELDRDLIPVLQLLCKKHIECHLHQADAMRFDFKKLLNNKNIRIFGNLPYNISTQLLFHLLDYQEYIKDMHFMLQREVAERLCASPGSKIYGRLSVMIQYHCLVKVLFHVPPTAFQPTPSVHSSFVYLEPRKSYPLLAHNYTLFSNVVRQAFNQRRKTIRNSLKSVLSKAKLESAEIETNSRPEQLSVTDFVKLSNLLTEQK